MLGTLWSLLFSGIRLCFFIYMRHLKINGYLPLSLSHSWPGSCSVIHSKQFFPVSHILIWQHYRLYSSPLSVISETITYGAVGEFSDPFISPYKKEKQLYCYSFLKSCELWHKCSLMRGVMTLFLIKRVSFWVGLVTLFLLYLITLFVPKGQFKENTSANTSFWCLFMSLKL